MSDWTNWVIATNWRILGMEAVLTLLCLWSMLLTVCVFNLNRRLKKEGLRGATPSQGGAQ